jgi:ribose 5-phosphate isomerase B
MRVHLGCDHAGYEFKELLRQHLESHGHEVVDHGAFAYDALDDYPPFCISAAQGVVADQAAGLDALGVVIGGSGNGEQIAANKVDGARCALVWSADIARLAREHNDANLMGIGARQHSADDAVAMVDAFLSTPFASGDDAVRHSRRIALLSEFEQSR